MNHTFNTLRVAAREVGARRVLIPAAIAIGTLTMLAIRSLDHDNGDADNIMNGTWIATLVISVIVGMSLLGEELSNGRLSFYFARPFSESQIFGGKLLGGVFLALVIQGTVILLVGLGLPAIAWEDSGLATRTLAAVVSERILATGVAVTFGMAVGIVLQSKTRWIILDVACVALVGVVTAAVALRVSDNLVDVRHGIGDMSPSYDRDSSILQVSALAVAVLGLAIATARAMTRGRTDRERAHAALSTTLWPIVMPAAGILIAVTAAWF